MERDPNMGGTDPAETHILTPYLQILRCRNASSTKRGLLDNRFGSQISSGLKLAWVAKKVGLYDAL